MDSWPQAQDDLRDAYETLLARHGKHRVVAEMSRLYGLPLRAVYRRLDAAGVRMAQDRVERPGPGELAADYEADLMSNGERGLAVRLAAKYGVTATSVRKWLENDGLYVPAPRLPGRPITTRCPCGAGATTRYKGQDPPLCLTCYGRAYAADPDSGFRRAGREYIAEVKRSAACADCGGKYPPCVFHFDHVPERGPKLFNIGNGDYAIETIKAEIAKCDIVCANCHAIRTWITRGKPLEDAAVPA